MSENGTEKQDGFGQWCILEIMGHRKLGGYVTEQPLFGTAMLRIDIPAGNDAGYMTEYYGGSSIYALHPVSEQIARAFAARSRIRPVEVYELALLEPAKPIQGVQDALDRYGFTDEEGEEADVFDPDDDENP